MECRAEASLLALPEDPSEDLRVTRRRVPAFSCMGVNNIYINSLEMIREYTQIPQKDQFPGQPG